MTDVHFILDQDFETYQLKDIVQYGCQAGVHGFVYTVDVLDAYKKHEEEILSHLNCYIEDTVGAPSIINYLVDKKVYDDTDQLHHDMVWMYVEVKAMEILNSMGIDC